MSRTDSMITAMAYFAFFCMPLAIPTFGGELDDNTGRRAAIEAVASKDGSPSPDCLKTRRKEEVEESLFELRREKVIGGKLNEEYFVYEVVDVGCYKFDGSSLVISAIDHPGTYGYVVVNKRSGSTYRLWSDKNAADEFNRLISDLGVQVSGESKAVSAAHLYRELVIGPYKGNEVYSDLQVKQLAEDSFCEAFDKGCPRRFSGWWSRFKRSKKINYEEVARIASGEYEVTGKAFEGFALTIPRTKISGRPSVREWVVVVDPKGKIRTLPARTIFE